MRGHVLVLLVALGAGCGPDEAGNSSNTSSTTSITAPPPHEAEPVQVVFQVKHPDDTPGTATVRYTDPDGQVIEIDVELPWTSKRYLFDPSDALRLTATSTDDESYLQCDGLTDQGPYGRTSGSSETGRCEVDTTLAELGDRYGD